MTRDEAALRRTIGRLAGRPAEERAWVVRRLTMPEKRTLDEFWPAWAHDGQLPPAMALDTRPSTALPSTSLGAGSPDPSVWLMMTGRGFGKTRAGAEWVSALARQAEAFAGGGPLRIALVGATIEDAVKVMVTGRSGLLAVARTGERPSFNKTDGIVRFPSGAEAFLYSGACPEKLRGPEHHLAWCDEIAKWRRPEETWDNLRLGLRLGERSGPPPSTSLGTGPSTSLGTGAGPLVLVTTTPKTLPLLKRLLATSLVTRGRTADNLNLPPAFVARMEAEYRGSRKGREELDGEMIEDVEGALWTRALIETARVEAWTPAFAGERAKRIVIGVDPPASADGDACGIVACALAAEGIGPSTSLGTGYVLGDHSVRGLSPEGWARAVANAAEAWGADCVIVESNQGGDMATSVLRTADPALPVRPVHARYGRGDRAEPVAMLFETGRAKLAGRFPELEDEMCAMTRGGGYAVPGKSPDRADAMVWAMTELMLGRKRAPPRIRQL